jgi:hypothetical protein
MFLQILIVELSKIILARPIWPALGGIPPIIHSLRFPIKCIQTVSANYSGASELKLTPVPFIS